MRSQELEQVVVGALNMPMITSEGDALDTFWAEESVQKIYQANHKWVAEIMNAGRVRQRDTPDEERNGMKQLLASLQEDIKVLETDLKT